MSCSGTTAAQFFFDLWMPLPMPDRSWEQSKGRGWPKKRLLSELAFWSQPIFSKVCRNYLHCEIERKCTSLNCSFYVDLHIIDKHMGCMLQKLVEREQLKEGDVMKNIVPNDDLSTLGLSPSSRTKLVALMVVLTRSRCPLSLTWLTRICRWWKKDNENETMIRAEKRWI